MKKALSVLTLITVLLFAISSIAQAHEKVVVIPLNKPGVITNQSCPDENSHIVGIDSDGKIICGTQSCPGESQVVGIDASGNFICGTKTVFLSSVKYNGNLGGLAEQTINVIPSLKVQAYPVNTKHG